jgi:hypothetical protein
VDTRSGGLVFIRSGRFERGADGLLDEEDVRLLENRLTEDPHAGEVIVGGHGVRKLRVASSGRGKRGGSRVLYLYIQVRSRIHLLAVFAKSDQEDLNSRAYRDVIAEAMRLKEED